MNDGDSADLTGLREFPFGDIIHIDLYDYDVGGWFDDNDHLGTKKIDVNEGLGKKEHSFTGDGANYILTYEILPD